MMDSKFNDNERANNSRPVLNRQVSNISDVAMDSGRHQDGVNPSSRIRPRHSLVSLPSIASPQPTQDFYTSQQQPPPLPSQVLSRQGSSQGQDLTSSPAEIQNQHFQDYDRNSSQASTPNTSYHNDSQHSGASQTTAISTPRLPLRSPNLTPGSAMSYRGRQGSTVHEEDKTSVDITSIQFTGYSGDPTKSPGLSRLTPEPSPLFGQDGMGFDLSTAAGLGPWTQSQEDNLREVYPEQGARLAGGLGSGFRTATIREADLVLAAPPSSNKKEPLSFTKQVSAKLSRMKTIRLAQSEADRRDEIIEVIMECPPKQGPDTGNFDMSDMGGPSSSLEDLKSPFQPGMRRTTFPTKDEEKTQLFYPQPNWRPFVMRGPYMGYLILLALGMGIGTELLYRQSVEQPLLTFKSPEDISAATYLTLKFGPTIVSVVFGVLWQMTDIEVRRLEPFHQLSKPEGALAQESISIDYITFISFLRPFRAMQYGHYAVFLSSAASLLATTLVPTLGAASIVMTPNREQRLANPGVEKSIIINPVWARCLTSVLVIVAFLGGVLLYVLNTRKSGLSADVKGISGLASMAVVSHILMDFQDMDTAQPQDIHRRLKNRRYAIRNSSLAPMDSQPVSLASRRRTSTLQDSSDNNESGLSQNPHPLMLRAAGCVPLIGAIVVFFILVYVVIFVSDAAVITDRAPWIITMLAVTIKMGWGGLDADLRMMEPYHILWRRHAPPKTLTLDYTAMPVGWVAVKGLFNRHFLVFLVGLGTVMSEVLTVLVTSLATVSGQDFLKHEPAQIMQPTVGLILDDDEEGGRTVKAGQETQGSFFTTLAAVSFILIYMAIVAGAVAVKRGKPFLPRQPNTIASVLAFIHQSKMVYDFVGTSKFNRNAMKKRLAEVGKTYGVGWFTGRDGQTHCGVDEEELLGDFIPGYGLGDTKQPWVAV
ncbi:hypothetical protein MCOR27_003172 [Pyricularia oryzae]|uniref:Spray n=2 Tax=Pyricularia TaxID=48558 RepID=A0ABQ8NT39_PYRGI|nr:hypothetical protein MCOR01_008785 [Pyricularia oryzae]KAI6301769.1 hypothetical protein MCOR33_002753 [Pyricularia grisea]KAI6253304.1 hypothetical protein MCOR19_010123 [Pyricularia oryzae]KAI6266337.1 hypothetical protein MCOR26_010251 [Pyricularia oryzae]KAI6283645.1 hypothetical protein MCOR27_003172 [Pyricularia oryzae]